MEANSIWYGQLDESKSNLNTGKYVICLKINIQDEIFCITTQTTTYWID